MNITIRVKPIGEPLAISIYKKFYKLSLVWLAKQLLIILITNICY